MSRDRDKTREIAPAPIRLNITLQWEHAGLHCLILFHELTGCFNGYVGVTKGHPYFGKDYHEEGIENLEVHGGVTFTGTWVDVEDGLWYIGFDTAHAMDVTPAIDALLPPHLKIRHTEPGTAEEMVKNATQFYKETKKDMEVDPFRPTYKREGYVKNECERLAEQLSEVQKRHRRRRKTRV